jgi:hypothetical protein
MSSSILLRLVCLAGLLWSANARAAGIYVTSQTESDSEGDSEPSCPSSSQVAEALRDRLGSDAVTRFRAMSDSVLYLRVSKGPPARLLVQFTYPAHHIETGRALDIVDGQCEAVAQTVALIVEGWMHRLAVDTEPLDLSEQVLVNSTPDTPPENHRPTPRPEPDAGHVPAGAAAIRVQDIVLGLNKLANADGGLELDEAPPSNTASTPVWGPNQSADGGVLASAEVDGGARRSRRTGVFKGDVNDANVGTRYYGPPPETGPELHLAANIGVNGQWGPGGAGYGVAQAVLEVDGRYAELGGIRLRGALDTLYSQETNSGTISMNRATLAALLYMRIPHPLDSDTSAIQIGTGSLFEHLSASSTSVSYPGDDDRWNFGAIAQAHWIESITELVHLEAGPEIEYLPRSVQYKVPTNGPEMDTPHLWVGVTAGVGLDIF